MFAGGLMQTREMDVPAQARPVADLVFRTSVNWTYVLFFACLGGLHLTIATLAFLHGRFEAYLSIVLGLIFVGVSMVAYRCTFELASLPRERRMRLRSGTRRMHYQRYIPFT